MTYILICPICNQDYGYCPHAASEYIPLVNEARYWARTLYGMLNEEAQQIIHLTTQLADLEHERQDNTTLLWKVAKQQKEIEQLRSIIERRVGMLSETARESKRRIIRVIPPSPTTDDCQK